MTILVLHDDNSSVKIWIRSMTQALARDFRVACVTSASDAEALLKSLAPDCLILDLGSGEAVATFERIRDQKIRIPIFAFGGRALRGESLPGIELQSKETLSDPIALKKIISDAAGRRS